MNAAACLLPLVLVVSSFGAAPGPVSPPAAGGVPVGRVELELVGEAQMGSPMAFQDWLQALNRVGVKNVRLRTAHESDRPKLELRGTPDRPVYALTGIITSKDELVLPGGRFKRSEIARLTEWLRDMERNGPASHRELKASFGLTTQQLEDAQADLARPVAFSTKGMNRTEALQKIGRQLSRPIRVEGMIPTEGGNEEIAEELMGMACGTSLACVLRPMGFCMVPKMAAQGLTYVVAKAKLDQEVWPVGWAPDQPPAEIAPGLFEFRNVNVQGVPVSKVIAAISGQIKLPVLVDHNALARHGIDPEKAIVSHPQGRTNYSLALRKILFQARMKFEVRVDENRKVFLWVTSVKPV